MFWGKLLRENGKGAAVGYIGGSNNTYWDEDYWWGVGSMLHQVLVQILLTGTGLGVYDCWI